MGKITKFTSTKDLPYTMLLYGQPGTGKTTTLGLIAQKQEKGKLLIADVDRTSRVLNKLDNTDNVLIRQIDTSNTWDDWTAFMKELEEMHKNGKLKDIETIAVDNISELERGILADLGSKGKNKGVPSMSDYQYMQFKLINSLRFMKSLGVNIVWTAWQTIEDFENIDGSKYSREYPSISRKIVDNVCGLSDIVAKIMVNKEGRRGMIMEGTPNTYAKNQVDDRKGCLAEEFIKSDKKD